MNEWDDDSRTRPVFVIGTGRSGTHWLSETLAVHPEVDATIEAEPQFELSTGMALDATRETDLFPQLVAAYKEHLAATSARVYLDKSHPNVWLAERLKWAFPESLFVAIERNVYATVASMMLHETVANWHRRWREFPVPNRFLGITREIAREYDQLPMVSRCALRWRAHRDRLAELRTALGNDLHVISYESFAADPQNTSYSLQQFLGLHEPLSLPEVRTESLHKWRTQLTDEDVRQIQSVAGEAPGD